MASIVKRRSKYYARVSLWDGSRQRIKEIPLRTQFREEALIRKTTVERVEKDIKEGREFSFPWMNDDGLTIVSRLALSDAVKEYIKYRKLLNIRPTTIAQNELALKHFRNVVGDKCPIKSVNAKNIEQFIRKWKPKHSITTINMNLRAIRTFFKWAAEKGYLSAPPKIKQILVDNSMPAYLSEDEFQSIIDINDLDEHYKSVFIFYRDTGLRLSEPFHAVLEGQILTIISARSKTRSQRQIELTSKQSAIVHDLQNRLGSNPKRYKIQHYSKVFKSACTDIGIEKHFHCLRHTFAVMEYLRRRDIYWVSKMLGHSSVSTTEVYTKFNIRKLEKDFPSLVASNE